MVKYGSLDNVFAALADPTRREILERLAGREASVTELAEPFAISLPAISKHLRVLEKAGLITRERAGRVHHLRLRPLALKEAAEWLVHYHFFWEEQFDSLSEYLGQLNSNASDEQRKSEP